MNSNRKIIASNAHPTDSTKISGNEKKRHRCSMKHINTSSGRIHATNRDANADTDTNASTDADTVSSTDTNACADADSNSCTDTDSSTDTNLWWVLNVSYSQQEEK